MKKYNSIKKIAIAFCSLFSLCSLNAEVREVEISGNYLSVPLKYDAPKLKMRISDAANPKEVLYEIASQIDFDNPDFVSSIDLARFKGRRVKIDINCSDADFAKLKFTDIPVVEASKDFDKEANRPRFHYTHAYGWMNDPNGLVYYKGKWHLFHQYNPTGLNWNAPMHWGHAESSDLVNWKRLPIAKHPTFHANGTPDNAYSGTAFLDAKNASGLFSSKSGGVIFAYTSTARQTREIGIRRTECLFISDDMKTFVEPEFNPIIETLENGRDPSIFFHEASNKWIILRYEEPIVKGRKQKSFTFYSSSDLKEWDRESYLDGSYYECPDIFELPVNGDKKNKKYMIIEANGRYVLGDFDGKNFKITSDSNKLFQGTLYAGQTFRGVEDGRTVAIFWIRVQHDLRRKIKMPFAGTMSIPVEISLHKEGDRLIPRAAPAKEILKAFSSPKNLLSGGKISLSSKPQKMKNAKISSGMSDFRINLNSPNSEFKIKIGDLEMSYSRKNNSIEIPWANGKVRKFDVDPIENGVCDIKILTDKLPCAIFFNGGKTLIYADQDFASENYEIEVSGKDAKLEKLQIAEFKNK